jgi:VWFA-related protein
MKAKNKLAGGFRILASTGILLLGLLTITSGQERRRGPQSSQDPASKPDKDFTVRIAVEEVRLDVVVLNKKGHQIPNLTANDFEIYQDGMPMEVRSCTYVTDQANPSKQPSVAPKAAIASKITPPISTLPISRDAVRRVIAFVVDDLSMTFESMQYVRKALKKFVENEMQTGDLVAILRTTHGNSALQMFLSDKKQLLAMIDTVRWGKNVGLDLDPRDLYMIFDGQLSTMRYCVGALKDMPGRKALVLMTSLSTLPRDWDNGALDSNAVDYDQLYHNSYSKMADEAMRAGVVIHTMDMRGLEAPFPDAPTDVQMDPVANNPNNQTPGMNSANSQMGNGNSGYRQIGGRLYTNNTISGDAQIARDTSHGPSYGQMGSLSTPSSILQQNIESRNPMSQKTGGLYLSNMNFSGIDEINDAMKGYYLLSYVPPPSTFMSNRQAFYHRISVRVNQSGVQVHTRDGFYGLATPPTDTAEASNPMREAIFSPFRHSDLKVNLAAGYLEDDKAGYLVRSWLHLNLNELQLVKATKDGQPGYNLELQTISVTNDVTSAIHDSSLYHHKFFILENNIEFIRKNGMRFSLAIPIKKPGPYYIRVAVKDEISGKIGSAYQFVEIPNLGKGDLALSNLFLINRKEDIAWILSGAPQENYQYKLVPNTKEDKGRSPALRSYHPGDSINYMSVVYNAKHDTGKTPDLETQFILYKDGQEILTGPLQALDLKNANNLKEIPIMGKIVLEKTLQEGDYILQLLVRDKLAGSKKGLATQTLDFSIEKPDSSMQ